MVAIASEDQEQTALAQYLDMRFGEYGWFHPPNGGSRNVIEATKLKRMGVKKGVPDVIIPCACVMIDKYYNACAIELKRTKGGRVSPEQDRWHHELERRGWLVRVCHGSGSAIDFVESLLWVPPANYPT